MKKIVYVYILDGMADWELGYIMSAINMKSIPNKGNKKYCIKTVGSNKEPIHTLGGLTILPDSSVDEIKKSEMAALLLPGSDKWDEPKHKIILEKIKMYMDKEILVAAICGATLALANLGILNTHLHTSNSIEYLNYFSEIYTGEDLYQNDLSFVDKNLITANSAGGLLWAKQIMQYLKILPNEMIEAWFNYYSTGDPKYYMELLSLSTEV
ncbi:DJ-1/PfpI family protein [Psychrilyobacter atlanticus]|uniref:DJ-1/PfpI family protein n=1 Tax=Psychrilyobacter atlanticus TaxID=271091 RepID=UPI00040C869D|nr:DJ-1/PfpI family protein [Psychrilyobacter atlanticus]